MLKIGYGFTGRAYPGLKGYDGFKLIGSGL